MNENNTNKNDFVIPLTEGEKTSEVIVEPNRPAHWFQRFAAGIIDICLLFLATFGLRALFSYTPIEDPLKENRLAMIAVQDELKITPLVPGSDETYGYQIFDDEPAFNDPKYKDYPVYTTKEAPVKKYKVADYDGITDEVKNAYYKAINENKRYQNYWFNYRLIDYGMTMLACGISEAIFLLAVPLLNKRRATLGNLFSGLQVINSKYQVEARWYQIVGKFIWILVIETALPFVFISNLLITILAVGGFLAIFMLFNKDRRTLHDYISRTRIIDKRTFVRLNDQ